MQECNNRGISQSNRLKLELLHRGGQDVYSTEEISRLWNMALPSVTRLLAHLAESGWLVRVRRGFYAVTPLEASQPHAWKIDPWISAEKAYAPCYIGGWSAGEHWGLTEQIFRDLLVVTACPVRHTRQKIQESHLSLHHRDQSRHFGVELVWRGQARVAVSDPSKTVIDFLADPRWAGGMRHGADMLVAYFEDHLDETKLLDYSERLGIRTVYKRLGYLTELLDLGSAQLRSTCHDRLSKGISDLDPSSPCEGPILTDWALRINVRIPRGRSA